MVEATSFTAKKNHYINDPNTYAMNELFSSKKEQKNVFWNIEESNALFLWKELL